MDSGYQTRTPECLQSAACPTAALQSSNQWLESPFNLVFHLLSFLHKSFHWHNPKDKYTVACSRAPDAPGCRYKCRATPRSWPNRAVAANTDPGFRLAVGLGAWHGRMSPKALPVDTTQSPLRLSVDVRFVEEDDRLQRSGQPYTRPGSTATLSALPLRRIFNCPVHKITLSSALGFLFSTRSLFRRLMPLPYEYGHTRSIPHGRIRADTYRCPLPPGQFVLQHNKQ